MKRALKQLCQEGSVRGAGRLALAPWNTKGSRVVEDDGKGVAVAVLELNTFLQTTALIMTDPLDLVQRGCDRNNQRGGKKVEEQPSWGMTDIFPSSSLIGIVRKKATTVFSSLGIRSINTQRTIVLS